MPTRHPPMEGQQKEIQYPGWYKDNTWKKLWSAENDKVSYGNKDVWGNIYGKKYLLFRIISY